ncbi:MAG TPA: hypothetical protein VNR86_10535 [Sphingomicrobium sp.]|nr:hypothetical protein [Sphingomicrobium sp.]
MPPTRTPEDLRMAKRHVSLGEQHVVQQEELITRLRLEGLPTGDAEQLLATFQSTLKEHRRHRDIIAAELRGDVS